MTYCLDYLETRYSIVESFFVNYAEATANCAKQYAVSTMCSNIKAFDYLFAEILPLKLTKKLGFEVNGRRQRSPYGIISCLSLPSLHWNPFKQELLCKDSTSPSGPKLLIHYHFGEPFMRMTLSHPFFVGTEDRPLPLNCQSLAKQRGLSKSSFCWFNLLEFSNLGEFAASTHSLIIYQLWLKEHPDIKEGPASVEHYINYLTNDIAEAIEKVYVALKE